MTDIVEQATRVTDGLLYGPEALVRPKGRDIAQALADAGLLRDEAKVREGVCLECGGGVLNNGEHIDPSRHRDYVRTRDSRTVPTRGEIAATLYARFTTNQVTSWEDIGSDARRRYLEDADAVLELLDDEVVLKGSAQQVREEQ